MNKYTKAVVSNSISAVFMVAMYFAYVEKIEGAMNIVSFLVFGWTILCCATIASLGKSYYVSAKCALNNNTVSNNSRRMHIVFDLAIILVFVWYGDFVKAVVMSVWALTYLSHHQLILKFSEGGEWTEFMVL